MDRFLIISGGAGVVCVLASLIGLGIASANAKHWGVALTCLAAFSVILFLLLAGWEMSNNFWERYD